MDVLLFIIILLLIVIFAIISILFLQQNKTGHFHMKVAGQEIAVDVKGNVKTEPAKPSLTPSFSKKSSKSKKIIKKNRSNQSKTPKKFWLETKEKDLRFTIAPKATISIGRGSANDIKIKDPGISIQQALIYWDKGRYKISNLSTSVPTFVNNRLINKHNLGNGNKISFGNIVLIFRTK